jgi:DNA-binding transcriptional MerR regulator
MRKAEHLLVGDLAKRFGISPQTVHWYEAQGLLPASERSDAGYRRFSREAADQLAFVRKALSIGFSVKDIKAIIEARSSGDLPCDLVLELLARKLHDLDVQIKALQDLQTQLKVLQVEWTEKTPHAHDHANQICPLIEES